MDDLYEAVDAFDIEMWASERGARWAKSNELLLTCPTCEKEKLCINVDKRTFHCWVCEQYAPVVGGRRRAVAGAGGLVELIALVDGCSKGDAADYVMRVARTTPLPSKIRGLRPADPTTQPLRWALPIDWPPLTFAIDARTYPRLPYLAQRGIAVSDALAFALAWCKGGQYANRLLFPVFERGRLVYYQARAMWEKEAHPADGRSYLKSLNPPRDATLGTTSADVLLNLDQARRHARVAIVEGPVDCVHAGPSAVATFGKKISHRQIQKLRAAGVQAVDLMWDGPSKKEPTGARPEMAKAAPLLAAFFDVKLVYLPEGDPGGLDRATLDRLRREAVRFQR